MSSWLPSRARRPLGPGVRWEDDERALRQIGPSAFFRFLRALSPYTTRFRSPRSRDGAAVTERTSVQRTFCQHDAQALLKSSTLRAAEPLMARCPFGRQPVLRGPWIPAFAGKTMRKIGASSGPLHAFPAPPCSPFVSPAKAGA